MHGLILIVAAMTLGVVEHGEAAFTPTAEEAGVPERFRMTPAVFPFEIEPRLDVAGYSVSAVRFPSPVESPDIENNIVHAEYFRPKGEAPEGGRPAVIVLHILGAD